MSSLVTLYLILFTINTTGEAHTMTCVCVEVMGQLSETEFYYSMV